MIASMWLLFGGIGDDDPALLDFLLLDRFNENPVTERFYVQCHSVCSVGLFVMV
jgi:hypothetical protein